MKRIEHIRIYVGIDFRGREEFPQNLDALSLLSSINLLKFIGPNKKIPHHPNIVIPILSRTVTFPSCYLSRFHCWLDRGPRALST